MLFRSKAALPQRALTMGTSIESEEQVGLNNSPRRSPLPKSAAALANMPLKQGLLFEPGAHPVGPSKTWRREASSGRP